MSDTREGLLHEIRMRRYRHRHEMGHVEEHLPDACPTLLDRVGGVDHVRLAEDLEIPTVNRVIFMMEVATTFGRTNWMLFVVAKVSIVLHAIDSNRALKEALIDLGATILGWLEVVEARLQKEQS